METWIIAGLGNPGTEYEKSRHNCGFRSIDKLAKKLGIEFSKEQFNAKCAIKNLEAGDRSIKLILMKPLTYMNNSGEAVQKAAAWYKVSLKNIVVIYDDTDIDVGALRVRGGGSAGTHNGMKSLVLLLSGDKFPRVRVGIGKRPDYMDMVDFVLGKFPKEQEEIMEKAFENAGDAAFSIVEEGIDKTMNRFNGAGNK